MNSGCNGGLEPGAVKGPAKVGSNGLQYMNHILHPILDDDGMLTLGN